MEWNLLNYNKTKNVDTFAVFRACVAQKIIFIHCSLHYKPLNIPCKPGIWFD